MAYMGATRPCDGAQVGTSDVTTLTPQQVCACGCGLPLTPKAGHFSGEKRFIRSHNGYLRGRMPTNIAERLWSRVNASDDAGACWEFTGARNGKGYGILGRGRRGDGNIRAHVAAFLEAGGELTAERPFVLHRCDNPPCCNPFHLRAGTPQENADDIKMRGRR